MKLKYTLNTNSMSSNFYILLKLNKSKKIIKGINENHGIYLNMQRPDNLK